MIITKLVSGLGNQLFQYAIGRHLSIRHGVPLKLDTGFFATQTLRSFKLDQYHIEAEVATPEEISRFLFRQNDPGLLSKLYRKMERRRSRHSRTYLKEPEWWVYDPDVLRASSHVYIDGYWQHYRYFSNVYPELFKELTIKKPVSGAMAFKEDICADQFSVSLHIRRGDYVTDADAYNHMGILPLEYYYSAIEYLDTKLARPAYYIFSDDLGWAKDNLKIKAPVTFVDIEGGSSDYSELDLMSSCSHNIIANSSFSWWGAFLNRNPNKLVIAPGRWAKNPELNKKIELQLPSWIKM